MSKSVLFIAPSAYPLGGVQTWLNYIIPGLEACEYEVTLALTEGSYHDTQTYLKIHPFKRVTSIRNPTGSIIGRTMAIEQLIVNESPNIIIVVNIVDVYPAVNNLRRKNFKQSFKVVTTIHGIHPGLIDDINTYRHVIDAAVTTNKLTQLLVLQNTNLEADRVLYAPYGVPELPTSFKRNPSQSEYTIAFAGRLDEDQKRIEDLLQILTGAIAQIPSLRILIAGDGDCRDDVEKWVTEYKSDANIHYFGTLNPNELRTQVYAQADVMLLTSHWETGPIVAWEAFRHGLALVTSQYIGCVEENSLIDGENCLMFRVGDVSSAIECLTRLQNKSLRASLVDNSQNLVEGRYSLNSSIKQWVEQLEIVKNYAAKLYKHPLKTVTDQGRIANWVNSIFGQLGLRALERVKKALSIRFKHTSAGGEWPHSYSTLDSQSSQLTTYIMDSRENHER